MARKKSFGRLIVYLANVFFAILLLCSLLAYFVPPSAIPFFAFAGLAFPVLLGINTLFLVFWLLKLDPRIFLSLICIGLSLFHIQRLYKFSGSNKVVNPTSSFKAMTYNVRMFNHYQWLPEEDVAAKIATEIQQQNPNILFLQEYYQTAKTPEFSFEHSYAKMTNVGKNYGLAIYSDYPIVNKGTVDYSDSAHLENNQFIFADIDIRGSTFRCINAHLASVGLGNSDYKRLSNPTEGTQQEIERGFWQIAVRIGKAFKRRTTQAEALVKAIEDSPFPVILAGDFNDTPSSYTYKRIDNLLTDSFLESGKGFSKTYVQSFIPLRIDYLFHGETLRAFNYHVCSQKLSDHYGVSVELEIVR